jgi:hypothetical protein
MREISANASHESRKSALDSARAPARLLGQRDQILFEIFLSDIDVVATFKLIETCLDLCSQSPQLKRVLAPFLLKDAERIPESPRWHSGTHLLRQHDQ